MQKIDNQEIRYATEEIATEHFQDMIERGEGIGTSDLYICVKEVKSFFGNIDIDGALILHFIFETIGAIEENA